MEKEKFEKFKSMAIPLPIEHVDTDQIIPARFLKVTTREGFGKNLFRDWRYDKEGKLVEDFVLNDSKYSGEILVVGKNFGSGSSREHAAWAIHDYGFKVVVSSFIADIFKNNSLNNGVLPIIISEQYLEKVFSEIEKKPSTEFEVNLEKQTFTILSTGEKAHFDISTHKKACLLHGYDDIDYLLNLKEEIEEFEKHKE